MRSCDEVSTVEDLVAAVNDPAVRHVEVAEEITGTPSIRLAPGVGLAGAGPGAAVVFAPGVDGVRLSSDNELASIRIDVTPACRAVFNDTAVPRLGTLRLAGVATVEVLQGGFTLWNRQPDSEAVLTAELHGIRAGRAEAPIRGSGAFVSGSASGAGATLAVSLLETGPVFTDGGIPSGTHNLISGGVFVLYGCRVEEVRNRGLVTTFGVNDMALDNWGSVERRYAEAPITTYGRSGVGFVNFGTVTTLRIAAAVETHGVGARGFNVYSLDGLGTASVGTASVGTASVGTAEFDSVTTHADAAVGIQIGQPIGRLVVHNGISTTGGAGNSLVKGVLTRLSAHALSVLPGGGVDEVTIGGPVTSAGAEVAAVVVQGQVDTMAVAGGIHASGPGADALHVDGGVLGLHDTELSAAHGAALRLTRATVTSLREVTTRQHGSR